MGVRVSRENGSILLPDPADFQCALRHLQRNAPCIQGFIILRRIEAGNVATRPPPRSLTGFRCSRSIRGDMDVPRFLVSEWSRFDGLVHGFLGRPAGQRAGAASCVKPSENPGDDIEAVKRNWCDLRMAIGLSEFTVVTARQIHGDVILKVSNGTGRHAGVGDGLMTDSANLVVGVTAADCVPILYVEPERRVAAAVHAGWRGTAAGIAARAITRMKEEYSIEPSAVHAALGPSIGPCCYEVGGEVAEQIAATWKEELKGAWRAKGVKGHLDLRSLNEAQLFAAGVPERQICRIGPCTTCHVAEFFSYRKEGRTGSQLSFIGWRS